MQATHYNPRRSQESAKAAYLAKVEELIIKAEPRYAGRLDWASLFHSWNTCRNEREAADRYLSSHTPED